MAASEAAEPARATTQPTASEALLLTTFFETLVQVDCTGRVLPGLAAQWAIGDDGRSASFIIRQGARFANGSPATAPAVVTAWAGRTIPFADTVFAADSRTIVAHFPWADSTTLRVFADPALSVFIRDSAGGPPLGTDPYRLEEWTPGRVVGAPARGAPPTIVFRFAPRADPRDLLDQAVDLVLTDDPVTVSYAQSRGDFTLAQLPWARTYVFVATSTEADGDTTGLAAGLSRAAVRGDVRQAEPPYWWRTAPPCRAQPGVAPGSGHQILFAASDGVARDIAERLVALAASGQTLRGAHLTAVAVPAAALDSAVRRQSPFGYVTSLPRRSYASCLDLPASHVVPLLDARSTAIARPGRVSLDVAWDGAPRLVLRP